MSLENEYRRILDESFGRHFTGWEALSPLDPIKVLAEAMSGSLSEIERRQKHYVSALMDSLPSLCGFAPKAAQLPVALIALSPVPRLSEAKMIPSGASFRFQKEEVACHALLSADTRVSPVYDFSARAEGPSVELRFRYQGVASDLHLQFVPEAGAVGANLVRAHLENGEILRTQESTSGFTRFGAITFRRGSSAVLFDQATQTVCLTLVFDRKPQGTFAANLVACRLAQVTEPLAIGFLTGEPWEEVPLPELVTEAPTECYLSFSDDKILKLTRRETSLLELKLANYELFKGSFFYNGANHSLVVPAADELIGNYNGKVQVFAERAVQRPPFESLGSEFQGRAGDHSAIVEKVATYGSLSTYLPREAKANYLARFYGAIGSLQGQAAPTLNLYELQQSLLSSEKDLRAVETEFDAKENCLTVYLLALNPEDSEALQLSPELLGRVSTRLSQSLPLTIRWQLRPFKKVPVAVHLKADANVAVGFANAGEACETVKERLKYWLRPAPFGQSRASTQYRLQDLSPVFSLRGLNGLVDKAGLLTDSVMRAPGEILEAEIRVEVSYVA